MSPKEKQAPAACPEALTGCADRKECLENMATGMAHDLNNLLAAITGNIAIISRELPPESPLRKNINHIMTAANRTLDLTNQLQLYAARGEFNMEKQDIHEFLDQHVQTMRQLICPAIELRYKPASPLPPVRIDKARLALAISHIVNNAAESIFDAHGLITISTRMCRAEAMHNTRLCSEGFPPAENLLCLGIKDNGCGMTQDTLSRMFDPFFTTKIRGRGMGASVALGVVRAHGGLLTVASERKAGTTITILLPT